MIDGDMVEEESFVRETGENDSAAEPVERSTESAREAQSPAAENDTIETVIEEHLADLPPAEKAIVTDEPATLASAEQESVTSICG